MEEEYLAEYIKMVYGDSASRKNALEYQIVMFGYFLPPA